jgi:hypothetical protein
LFLIATAAQARDIAPTPPMGWNSWDAYRFSINEADFKANAAQLAKLRPYGWTYADRHKVTCPRMGAFSTRRKLAR